MKELKFRTLTADEIDCRVGTISAKGFSLLLYKDARCDQNVLDETVGAYNWQRDHKEVKGNMFCGVSIWDDDRKQWVTKWDCGVESNTEKEKGEASDSFKRACFNWGIGRELYTAPFIWVSGNTEQNAKGNYIPKYKSIKVIRLEYNDGHISALTISGDGEVIFEWGAKKAQTTQKALDETKTTKPSVNTDELTLEQALNFKTTKGTFYSELGEEQLQYIVDNSKNALSVKAAKLIIYDRQHKEDFEPIPEGEEGLPF